MWVACKTHGRFNDVIVNYPEQAKVHPLWIVIIGKAEAVSTDKPAVISKTTGVRFVNDLVHKNTLFYRFQTVACLGKQLF